MKKQKKKLKATIKKIRKYLTNKRLYLILSLVLLVLAAIAIVLFIQFFYHLGGGAVKQFLANPRLLWYSILIIFSLLVLLTGILGDAILASATMLAVSIILSFVNINKFRSRGAPLIPEDFLLATEAESLVRMVNPFELVRTICLVILTIALAIVIRRYMNAKFKIVLTKRFRIITRLALIVCGILFLMFGTAFIRNSSGENYEKNEFLNTTFVAWNQAENYNRNGFIIGFIYNLQVRKMAEPAHYSKETIVSIAEKYQMIANEKNADRIDLASESINIIYIMNESFFDLSTIKKYYPYSGGNITPNLHELAKHKNSAYGTSYTSEYGGGTANVEFEALTGFTNYFANVMPYVHFVPKNKDFPSISRVLKTSNYAAIGIHPYVGSMYKRSIVYNNLGFDNFFDINHFDDDAERIGLSNKFVSDNAVYDEILKQIQDSEAPLFTTAVTMQNHMPYGDQFADNHFTSTAKNVDEYNRRQINDYMEMVNISDSALGRLIKQINKMDEKVAIVFWGDHAPGIFGSHLGAIPDQIHQTPLLFYTNFQVASKHKIGAISPNYINTSLLDFLGAKKPPFYYLLDDLKKTSPKLSRVFYRDGLEPKETSAFLDYELINYDILSGKKYSLSLDFFNPNVINTTQNDS